LPEASLRRSDPESNPAYEHDAAAILPASRNLDNTTDDLWRAINASTREDATKRLSTIAFFAAVHPRAAG